MDLCSDVLEDENILPTEESYNPDMVAEHAERAGDPEAQRLLKSKVFWRQMKLFMDKMFESEKRGNRAHEEK
eukprot:3009335-Karenia_brevis.AAC.1